MNILQVEICDDCITADDARWKSSMYVFLFSLLNPLFRRSTDTCFVIFSPYRRRRDIVKSITLYANLYVINNRKQDSRARTLYLYRNTHLRSTPETPSAGNYLIWWLWSFRITGRIIFRQISRIRLSRFFTISPKVKASRRYFAVKSFLRRYSYCSVSLFGTRHAAVHENFGKSKPTMKNFIIYFVTSTFVAGKLCYKHSLIILTNRI